MGRITNWLIDKFLWLDEKIIDPLTTPIVNLMFPKNNKYINYGCV